MTTEKFHKVIEQINKLFRLAKSPNEHEAALAVDMARKIMLKYNIDEHDLGKTSSVEDIIEIDFVLSSRTEDHTIRFAHYVGRAFLCKVIMIKRSVGTDKLKFDRSIRFIGKKADVAVSSYVFSYIQSIVEIKASEHIAFLKANKAKAKTDYRMGYITAVCVKLEAIEAENKLKMSPTTAVNALIVVTNALIERHMKEKYGDGFQGESKTIKSDAKHFDKGYLDGEKQGIFRGIASMGINNKLGGKT